MTETTLSKRTQAVVAIVLAIVLFLAVNIFTNNTFRSARADLTETGLYSLSQGTRDLLANLEEPLQRLFLSKSLVQSAPQLSAYANRVQSLLATYRNLANGRITLEVIDPEPFSDAEDRAVAFGINRLRATGGPEVFFGLAATNSTNGRGQIPVFSPDREAFLEYDITRLIAELGQPAKPVIALVDGIGMAGNPMLRVPEQQILR
ncbi:MAG: GldG family protein, partial [Pseudomonadota bacterium]